jgi:hypothetical protein
MVQLQKFDEGLRRYGFMRGGGQPQFHGNKAPNLRNIGFSS